jgi:hypothetical protein
VIHAPHAPEMVAMLWQGIADACFEHDAGHERRACDELHQLEARDGTSEPRPYRSALPPAA